MALTLAKLKRFVEKRNKSGFPSNMQFHLDAEHCGFEVKDLGDVSPFTIDGFGGYEWNPIINGEPQRLVEFGRLLYLQGHPTKRPDTEAHRQMFELMNAAVYKVTA